MILLSLVAAVMLALIHLFAGKLRFLHVVPLSRWLSMAGGASVAYVFLLLLPELSEQQEVFAEAFSQPFLFVKDYVYLLALIGLVTFYGLEHMARRAPKRTSERPGKERAGEPIFWIHITSFALYNLLIGYLLLHRESSGPWHLSAFALAMGLHFLVNDYGLNEKHEEAYEDRGRWIMATAVVAGWLTGYLTIIPKLMIALLTAFLAGGVVLNVLKEELPEERQSRVGAFATGALAYAILLLAL